jgi:G3E family GTPase
MKTRTNLITGFLGVGKTTAILDLLGHKPAKEKWAVLVNEFGQVGIDGATLSERGVAVREVAGGCICCTAQLPLRVALTKLLREVKPERLIIEPTGVGHPMGVIDALRDTSLAPHLDLVNVITLVDPHQFLDPRFAELEAYQDQINLADVLVANKCDLAERDELGRLLSEGRRMYPPKLLVTPTERGHLEPAWLDMRTSATQQPRYHDAHAGSEGETRTFASRGWIFDATAIFDYPMLQALLRGWAQDARVLRAKGVLRIGRDWRHVELAGGQVEVKPISYRRDSRIEIVTRADATTDWNALERALRAAIRQPANAGGR